MKRGDTTYIKPEHREGGDDVFPCVALEDEDGGRVLVEHLCGLPFNPTERINTDLLMKDVTCVGTIRGWDKK